MPEFDFDKMNENSWLSDMFKYADENLITELIDVSKDEFSQINI